MKTNLSDSKVQLDMEKTVIEKLNKEYGYNLKPEEMVLEDGISVFLDGYDENEKIICEIYSKIGKLKGSQPDKVASDFLKMLLVEKAKGCQMKKIFCFVDGEAASKFINPNGKSWLNHAKEKLDIDIKVIELTSEERNEIENAQKNQNLLNQKMDKK